MPGHALQPLPEAHLIAADLRRKAAELILAAERLEAAYRVPRCTLPLTFAFGKKRKSLQKKRS